MNHEITLLLCECCFDVILENDAEYYHDISYCHHCIDEVKP